MNLGFLKKLEAEFKNYSQNPKLLAVTKYSNFEEVNFAIKNGIKIIGESRLEVAEEKFPKLIGEIEKHFIGIVQTKKLRKIFKLFDVIQSIGSLKQLEKINQIAKEEGRVARIFLQFNISNEEQKSGFLETEILEILELAKKLKNVKIEGIMGMASSLNNSTEAEIRKQFKRVKQIFEKIKSELIENSSFKELSIGMSGDYKIALEEGATLVRIGSALFTKD